MTLGPQSAMRDVLDVYPGAQRALFRRYHIGGCASCGFQPTETLEQVCQRNNNLNVAEVLEHIRTSHLQDARTFITPKELAQLREQNPGVKLVDVRSREEYEAVHIDGSLLLSQPVMQEIMGKWPRTQTLVIIDHRGKQSLDAAAYFLGHGFENIRCLRGGIDAWSREIDPNLPRYQLGP
ncbi:MAG: rhodanese-like domain-containing protein [Verrucomicrobia subdivision 3 bacterium]|nr:rhodanese-like domain-containing protein [Limisphaerales bacterium]